jgi:hypothetical protein
MLHAERRVGAVGAWALNLTLSELPARAEELNEGLWPFARWAEPEPTRGLPFALGVLELPPRGVLALWSSESSDAEADISGLFSTRSKAGPAGFFPLSSVEGAFVVESFSSSSLSS